MGSAVYNDNGAVAGKDAGHDKTITYSNFHFTSEGLGDYTIESGSLNDEAKYGNGITSGAIGSIARRLVNVAQDDTDYSRKYKGNTQEAWNVVAAGTRYTAGIEDATNHTGLLSEDVTSDKAYVTYEANFVNGATKDANVAFDTEGNVDF